ncbi:hypothetical protein AVEN_135873-1 [Araneus ventricosus]|uniref:Uncharacterized protein n=1 Tax=Araneus ventricosus TaxID=182803 RepID=A0A4Y2J4F0_ARAVE|nr:hypothetical protein AVEN_135873-1 [Araneus ventricosus]
MFRVTNNYAPQILHNCSTFAQDLRSEKKEIPKRGDRQLRWYLMIAVEDSGAVREGKGSRRCGKGSSMISDGLRFWCCREDRRCDGQLDDIVVEILAKLEDHRCDEAAR